MEERRRLDNAEGLRKMRRGWYLGDEEFGRELLEQMSAKMGGHHGGSRETTMSWKWIAGCLVMGAAGYAAACVRGLLR